jgi:hypothetical protein
VERVAQAGMADILEYLHAKLDLHFSSLRDSRSSLQPPSPVFALEHDLAEADLGLLKDAVRGAVRTGFPLRARRSWLPFVVYATEVGYDYVGDEYWTTFEAATPTWAYNGDRQVIKTFFLRFAEVYGGARPTGAWAEHFRIICWPITHAVLPTYLQRNLAQLMFEYRRGLTTDLLSNPTALGAWLGPRAAGYTERFRIFCQNTSLLGQVAAALLSGDGDESPNLLGGTLHRIVEGLSAEAQSRAWLHGAKQHANQVRLTGMRRPTSGSGGRVGLQRRRTERLPAATDPEIHIRRERDGWHAYALLPDFSSLRGRLPHLYDELRTLRARIAGGGGAVLARGRLTYPGQEVPLQSWPASDAPFVQLERGSPEVNALLADQCVMSTGPWWLFHVRSGSPAVLIKGNFLRPGEAYCLVGRDGAPPPAVPWVAMSVIVANGACAFDLAIPETINEEDVAALGAAGLAVVSDVKVRPVGLVARAWDGAGAVEWLAGDPAMIAIRAERLPNQCILAVDGTTYLIPWPGQQGELFVALDGLGVGSHELSIALLTADTGSSLASGTVTVTIHDHQVRPVEATKGEGVRLLASPARPTLNELWEGRADVTVLGPQGVRVSLSLALRGSRGEALAKRRRDIALPVNSAAWRDLARQELHSTEFRNAYDMAESCELSVDLAGIGFASLTCERGFQPLRWVLRKRGRVRTARLIDRTDGGNTHVEYYAVAAPTVALTRPIESEECPAHGGLVRAVSGESVAAMVLPPEPNGLLARGSSHPVISSGPRTVDEVTRLLAAHGNWSNADLPADPFAAHDQSIVLEAITSALVSRIAGPKWSRIEQALDRDSLLDELENMQEHVGESLPQRALADVIASRLWRWASSSAIFESEFAEAIANIASSSGLRDRPDAADFILKLAHKPGSLATWEATDRARMIDTVLRSPVLIRAARFAILGVESMQSGVGTQRSGSGR